MCFNQILNLIIMALDNIFERVCLQYPLTIYPGSTLWKMCANLDLLVIKIRLYYDKPPTISHIFILQWAQNIYDVEFGFLWYFRKTFWFNACNGRDFETNISSNCMSFLMKFIKTRQHCIHNFLWSMLLHFHIGNSISKLACELSESHFFLFSYSL